MLGAEHRNGYGASLDSEAKLALPVLRRDKRIRNFERSQDSLPSSKILSEGKCGNYSLLRHGMDFLNVSMADVFIELAKKRDWVIRKIAD